MKIIPCPKFSNVDEDKNFRRNSFKDFEDILDNSDLLSYLFEDLEAKDGDKNSSDLLPSTNFVENMSNNNNKVNSSTNYFTTKIAQNSKPILIDEIKSCQSSSKVQNSENLKALAVAEIITEIKKQQNNNESLLPNLYSQSSSSSVNVPIQKSQQSQLAPKMLITQNVFSNNRQQSYSTTQNLFPFQTIPTMYSLLTNPNAHIPNIVYNPTSNPISSNFISLNTSSTDMQPDQNNIEQLNSSTNQTPSLFKSINLIIYKYQRCNPTISIESGSIFNSKCHVIVNSIGFDKSLKPLTIGKLTNQIIEKGGNCIKNEIENASKFILNFDKSYSYFLTDSGNLKIENNIHSIYHTHLDSFNYVNDTSEISFKNTIKSLLQSAISKNFKSIAFPALGCGELLFPPSLVVKWFDDVFKTFFLGHTNHSLQQIKIVLYESDKTVYDSFNNYFLQKDIVIHRPIGKI